MTFAVIFEARSRPEYPDLARLLRPELERIDGFIDNERCASQRAQGRILYRRRDDSGGAERDALGQDRQDHRLVGAVA